MNGRNRFRKQHDEPSHSYIIQRELDWELEEQELGYEPGWDRPQGRVDIRKVDKTKR